MKIRSPYPKNEQELEEEGTEGSTDESNDEEFEPMPHLADGDIVLDEPQVPSDDFGVDKGDSDTVKVPLTSAPPPPPPAAASMMPPKPAATPPAAPPAPAAPTAPSQPLPGMPPHVTPDMLQQYLGTQRAQLNKYGPDRQFNTEEALLKNRTGPLATAANVGATLADGIMQGVARAGNPGYAQQLEARRNDADQAAIGALDRARKGSMESVEANQKLDAMDPGSGLSKSYQQAFAPVFAKMGYPAKSVAGMPASQIGSIADLGVRYADAQTQLELKKAMLQVQTLTAQAGIANQESERREEALKELQGMPWYSRLMHPGISSALQKEAGIDKGESPSFTSDVVDFARVHNMTPEQAQRIKDMRMGGK